VGVSGGLSCSWRKRDRENRKDHRKDTTILTLKITARYTRYLLSTLATVAFGTTMN
jgi:hypothetical protein